MDNKLKLLEVKQYKNKIFSFKTDAVILEEELTIFLNGERLTSLAVLPEHLPELTLGYLFSEGLVKDKSEIKSCNYLPGSNRIEVSAIIPEKRLYSYKMTGTRTSGCGSALSSKSLDIKIRDIDCEIKTEEILQLMLEFQKQSKLFHQTGGVHSAALVLDGKIINQMSDIGRHNALDKIIGKALQENLDLSKCYLISSGRISSEIMRKIIRLKIPLIVSSSAPTSEAVRLGWRYKTAIIGFARSGRFNQYTWFK